LIGDQLRLQQILINLVNNAVKFTEEGYVKLVVRHKEGLLVFAIKDSGIGICDSDLNKLFVAFSQVGRSITGNRGGTGLGLNISKYLSEKLGGNIKVVSEKGVGSCFTVSIALNEVKNSVWVKNEDDITNTIKSSCDPFKHKTQFNGKVLLAEDDEVLRKLFSIILENFGLAVTSVEDGKKLVEIALIEDFDLIFSDIHMPNMGGIEAMTLIKAAGCNSPFIALTANAMKHEVEHYMKAGFNGHLSKPIQRERFAHIINKYLNINSNNKQFEMPRNEIIALKNEFLDELPQYINKIKKALSEQNWQELQFHAHRLNGSSAVFKLNKITKLAAKLESALEKEEFPKNKHKMNNLLDDLFNCAEEASQKCKTVRNESLM
jgi:CheY-like chemotaxis protein